MADELIRVVERTAAEIDEFLVKYIVQNSKRNALVSSHEDVINVDMLLVDYVGLVLDIVGVPANGSLAEASQGLPNPPDHEFCRDGFLEAIPDMESGGRSRAVTEDEARVFIAFCRSEAQEAWELGWMPVIFSAAYAKGP